MKFKMFSVVVGTNACISNCPFCVSCERPNKDNLMAENINIRNFKIALNLANRSEIDTVMITSMGEPLLFPDQITEYLIEINKSKIPFVELQTNAILLWLNKEKYIPYLQQWYDLGLTTIAISTVHYDRVINDINYCTGQNKYPDLKSLVEFLHQLGFSVRLTCICMKEYIENGNQALKYIKFANSINAEQVTLRPLNLEYRREDARDFTQQNVLSEEQKEEIRNTLQKNGTKLLTLDKIGEIYDINGQNVCLSFPLTKYTRNEDPNNIRNLIFYPNGHIYYEWEMKGGILL